jgi:hypothetical protein
MQKAVIHDFALQTPNNLNSNRVLNPVRVIKKTIHTPVVLDFPGF